MADNTKAETVFREAWLAANARGDQGARVRAGIQALRDAGLLVADADPAAQLVTLPAAYRPRLPMSFAYDAGGSIEYIGLQTDGRVDLPGGVHVRPAAQPVTVEQIAAVETDHRYIPGYSGAEPCCSCGAAVANGYAGIRLHRAQITLEMFGGVS